MNDDHEDDPLTAEEKHTAELRMDAADEARRTEEERATPAPAGADSDECGAEFIDGSWTSCGCPDCQDREADEDELSAVYDEAAYAAPLFEGATHA